MRFLAPTPVCLLTLTDCRRLHVDPADCTTPALATDSSRIETHSEAIHLAEQRAYCYEWIVAGSQTQVCQFKIVSTQGFISNEAGRVKGVFVLFFTSLSICFSPLGTPVRLRGRAVLLDG